MLDYLENLFGSGRSGYSMKLFEAVVGEVEEQFNYPIQSVDPYGKLGRFVRLKRSLFMMSKTSLLSLMCLSVQLMKMGRVTLIATQGQGQASDEVPTSIREFDNLIG